MMLDASSTIKYQICAQVMHRQQHSNRNKHVQNTHELYQ